MCNSIEGENHNLVKTKLLLPDSSIECRSDPKTPGPVDDDGARCSTRYTPFPNLEEGAVISQSPGNNTIDQSRCRQDS